MGKIKTVSEKMGIKNGIKAILVDAPVEAVSSINFPDIVLTDELTSDFDYIHLFVKEQSVLKVKFPLLKLHLKSNGMLWVSWPKSGQLGTNLNVKNIINIGYSFGMVESTCLSINSTWSGLKFTYPKKGKMYNNSYGKLNIHNTNDNI
jgi:hypothetical protein